MTSRIRENLRCPNCFSISSKVSDTRNTTHHITIRRRRECKNCEYRWTTYEIDSEKYALIIPLLTNLPQLKTLLSALQEALPVLEPYRLDHDLPPPDLTNDDPATDPDDFTEPESEAEDLEEPTSEDADVSPPSTVDS